MSIDKRYIFPGALLLLNLGAAAMCLLLPTFQRWRRLLAIVGCLHVMVAFT